MESIPVRSRKHAIVSIASSRSSIVAIEIAYIFAQDDFRSRIYCSTYPSISVVSVPCNREVRFSLPTAKKLRGFIGRAVVYDNPFEVANRLPVQALIRAVQNMRPVVSGREDGNGGPGHFPVPPLAAEIRVSGGPNSTVSTLCPCATGPPAVSSAVRSAPPQARLGIRSVICAKMEILGELALGVST